MQVGSLFGWIDIPQGVFGMKELFGHLLLEDLEDMPCFVRVTIDQFACVVAQHDLSDNLRTFSPGISGRPMMEQNFFCRVGSPKSSSPSSIAVIIRSPKSAQAVRGRESSKLAMMFSKFLRERLEKICYWLEGLMEMWLRGLLDT